MITIPKSLLKDKDCFLLRYNDFGEVVLTPVDAEFINKFSKVLVKHSYNIFTVNDMYVHRIYSELNSCFSSYSFEKYLNDADLSFFNRDLMKLVNGQTNLKMRIDVIPDVNYFNVKYIIPDSLKLSQLIKNVRDDICCAYNVKKDELVFYYKNGDLLVHPVVLIYLLTIQARSDQRIGLRKKLINNLLTIIGGDVYNRNDSVYESRVEEKSDNNSVAIFNLHNYITSDKNAYKRRRISERLSTTEQPLSKILFGVEKTLSVGDYVTYLDELFYKLNHEIKNKSIRLGDSCGSIREFDPELTEEFGITKIGNYIFMKVLMNGSNNFELYKIIVKYIVKKCEDIFTDPKRSFLFKVCSEISDRNYQLSLFIMNPSNRGKSSYKEYPLFINPNDPDDFILPPNTVASLYKIIQYKDKYDKKVTKMYDFYPEERIKKNDFTTELSCIMNEYGLKKDLLTFSKYKNDDFVYHRFVYIKTSDYERYKMDSPICEVIGREPIVIEYDEKVIFIPEIIYSERAFEGVENQLVIELEELISSFQADGKPLSAEVPNLYNCVLIHTYTGELCLKEYCLSILSVSEGKDTQVKVNYIYERIVKLLRCVSSNFILKGKFCKMVFFTENDLSQVFKFLQKSGVGAHILFDCPKCDKKKCDLYNSESTNISWKRLKELSEINSKNIEKNYKRRHDKFVENEDVFGEPVKGIEDVIDIEIIVFMLL